MVNSWKGSCLFSEYSYKQQMWSLKSFIATYENTLLSYKGKYRYWAVRFLTIGLETYKRFDLVLQYFDSIPVSLHNMYVSHAHKFGFYIKYPFPFISKKCLVTGVSMLLQLLQPVQEIFPICRDARQAEAVLLNVLVFNLHRGKQTQEYEMCSSGGLQPHICGRFFYLFKEIQFPSDEPVNQLSLTVLELL